MRSIFSFILLALSLASAHPAAADWRDRLRDATVAERDKNRAEAIRQYTLAIAAPGPTPAERADLYYRRANVYGYLGRNELAIEDFSSTIELEPSHGDALSLRGYLRAIAGQYDASEDDHRRALEAAPAEGRASYLAWALQHSADLRRRQGRLDEALAIVNRAIAERDYADVRFRRAWIHLDMGKPDLARQDYIHFAAALIRDDQSEDVYWPDERAAIARLKSLADPK